MTASVTFQEPPPPQAPRRRGRRRAHRAAAVVVPKRAVVERGGQTSVWVVTGEAAASRAVTLGAERLDQVEVASGLVPGEAVVLNAPAGVDRTAAACA